MYSWLVTVLLLASAANSSGGQGAMGGGGGEGECWSVFVSFQVRKCPSQATHVHSLMDLALMTRNGAQSVVDFEHVRS